MAEEPTSGTESVWPKEDLRTIADVARYRGVSTRTVATWRDQGLPRRSLTPKEVDNWCRANGKGGDASDDEEEAERSRLLGTKLLTEVELLKLKRIKEDQARLARERVLIPRGEIHEALSRLAQILRGIGEGMEKSFGLEARRLLDDGLDEFNRELEASFSEQPPPDATDE